MMAARACNNLACQIAGFHMANCKNAVAGQAKGPRAGLGLRELGGMPGGDVVGDDGEDAGMTRIGEIGSAMNSDLTILFGCIEQVSETLEEGHPAREILATMLGAAQRCTWGAAELLKLDYCAVPVAADPLAIARAMIAALLRNKERTA